MKKAAIIIMTLALLLSVSSCGNKSGDTSDATTSTVVQKDVTAQSNADNNSTEIAEKKTDSKGNYVDSADEKSVEEQNSNAVENKSSTTSDNGTEESNDKKTNPSNKEDSTTKVSNPIGSGIELPEMEI